MKTEYYYSAYGWGIGDALLVKTGKKMSATYKACTRGTGCVEWHHGVGDLSEDAVQLTKCQARKYLKSWNSVLELPS